MLKVTVDRSRWLRNHRDPTGKKELNSLLLDENGYMCCVGFACLAAGLTEKDILGQGTVGQIAENKIYIPTALSKLVHNSSPLNHRVVSSPKAYDLYKANDMYGDEARVHEKGLDLGIEFTFVDGPTNDSQRTS